ncbi:hypothetical protein FWC31_01360 [Candidatus Saccharibacteria bacterium]|nr:hypothetical protein [Candidatus Saccharibacteria bacterium]
MSRESLPPPTTSSTETSTNRESKLEEFLKPLKEEGYTYFIQAGHVFPNKKPGTKYDIGEQYDEYNYITLYFIYEKNGQQFYGTIHNDRYKGLCVSTKDSDVTDLIEIGYYLAEPWHNDYGLDCTRVINLDEEEWAFKAHEREKIWPSKLDDYPEYVKLLQSEGIKPQGLNDASMERINQKIAELKGQAVGATSVHLVKG